MSAPLVYLLQANAALLLAAAVYYGLLRRLTFFGLNRAFLASALIFAGLCPALPVPAWWAADAALPTAFTNWLPTTAALVPASNAPEPGFDWLAAAGLVYLAGAAVALARLLLQLLAVGHLHRASRPAGVENHAFRQLPGAAGPFSFWQTIYLNPARHSAGELAAVLRHEQVHVRQWHTLDVLLAQLVLAAAWLNPAAWLLRRAVLDNLEYLADHHALQTGLDRQAYQYSLLRLSRGTAGPSLVSHFTFLTLKNRIVMMNAPSSATTQKVRYLLAAPLLLALALGFGAVQAHVSAPQALNQTGKPGPGTYYIDGKLSDKATADQLPPKSIAFMNMLDEATARKVFGPQSGSVAIIVTTPNQNSAAVLALNDKIARVAPLVPDPKAKAPVK